MKPLAEAGWRVLTPDNPGHGDSAAPVEENAYAMANVADLLHALATELGFAPAVIVGHSMGGAVAEEYAIRHGGDVAALVLVASAGARLIEVARQRTRSLQRNARRHSAKAWRCGGCIRSAPAGPR